MHLVKGRADALLAGVTRSYPETIRPSLHVVGAKGGRKVAGVYMAIWQNTVKFIADATVNVDPSSEELADIAQYTANLAQFLGFAPRVAMISFSNFGSNDHPHARKVSRAVELLRERNPKLMVDGEMQADVAVNPKLLSEQFPFTSLDKNKGANVLVFPELSSANVAYKLLGALGEAEMIGPILVGMDRPVHILPLGASEQDIINMATIAVLDAQRFGIHKVPEGPGRVVDAGKLFDAREW